ncbi:hypothetical protein J5N97_014393 [Dioscorea zingiberensis]|uniref:Thaumatin-like protein n=1 Tax=Dioscorea zingiberensis TaxID=325984 RepID=A0A9D5HJL2_9LILI|nr:hypothetical protein J5N97_014393 [Dioscorea zingiberensis]
MSTLIILSSLLLLLRLPLHHAAIFDIINHCPYTVWAAAIPGGGRKLDSGENWTINVNARMDEGRIWARTGCTFNVSGHGNCQTGDCNSLLECQTYGRPPNTLARFTLNGFNNLDFIDISLAEGFNVPMDFSPAAGCDQRIRCAADINGECPTELSTVGGCNDPCTVFKTDEYCCYSGYNCGPSNYSNFFKGLCPDVFSYPMDDQTSSTFTCIGGTDYKVVFCPTTNLSPSPPGKNNFNFFNF